jgi:hypothetical protein
MLQVGAQQLATMMTKSLNKIYQCDVDNTNVAKAIHRQHPMSSHLSHRFCQH